jgi:uncharacterized protein (UPF0332 family)
MPMSLSDLLKNRLVEKFDSDPEQIKNEMEIAKSNAKSARRILQIEEWEIAHNTAYNAMLQAARALMFAKGYRPMSQEHHVAVISFMQAVYSAKLGSQSIKALDNARKRRNESWYDRVGSISPEQARNLVETAEAFVSKAGDLLKI